MNYEEAYRNIKNLAAQYQGLLVLEETLSFIGNAEADLVKITAILEKLKEEHKIQSNENNSLVAAYKKLKEKYEIKDSTLEKESESKEKSLELQYEKEEETFQKFLKLKQDEITAVKSDMDEWYAKRDSVKKIIQTDIENIKGSTLKYQKMLNEVKDQLKKTTAQL